MGDELLSVNGMGQQALPAQSWRSSPPASIAASRLPRIVFLPESRRSISINFSDTDLENRIVATPVPDLEEFGNLVEGEPQPLRGLDDAKGRDRDWS
ncbi:MAG TPA: hypothetical protein VFJ83_05250 [Nocardioidaceae bacterium]|nr:hypothetical protein [Nocardioidaceae bacterium]